MGRFILLTLALGLAYPPMGMTRNATGQDHEIQKLQIYLLRHPGDPDLAWSLIKALQEESRTEDTIQELRAFVLRWPKRRPEAHLELGRLFYETKRYQAALQAVEDGLFLEPRNGPGRMYRALALQALGRLEEADHELQVSSYLESALEDERNIQ